MFFAKSTNLNITSMVREEEGFTLIELLIVIIIVGVLGAIALPSFLNQVAKARGAEAKSGIGAINRSQQAYRFENQAFSNRISNLDVRITEKFYNYTVNSSTQNSASHGTIPLETDLKQYSSWVEQNSDVFTHLICESNETSTSASATMSSVTCPLGYKTID